ncbi:hypothetical protein, partial [Jatrophihabitans sp.]|uniref:hypothetical protein n=1 Tax=Jatrophihabitans sp. TaxID=1932789 RepID=UPI002F0571DB
LFLDRPRRRSVVLPTSLAAPVSWRLDPGTHAEVIRLAYSFGYGGPGQHEPIRSARHPAGPAAAGNRAINAFGPRHA